MEIKCLACDQIFVEIDDPDFLEEIHQFGIECPFCSKRLSILKKTEAGLIICQISKKRRYTLRDGIYSNTKSVKRIDEFDFDKKMGGFA